MNRVIAVAEEEISLAETHLDNMIDELLQIPEDDVEQLKNWLDENHQGILDELCEYTDLRKLLEGVDDGENREFTFETSIYDGEDPEFDLLTECGVSEPVVLFLMETARQNLAESQSKLEKEHSMRGWPLTYAERITEYDAFVLRVLDAVVPVPDLANMILQYL